jgi:SAM-dependent methyltransferase
MSLDHLSAGAPKVLPSSRWRTWIRTYLLEPTLRRLPRTDRVLDLCTGYGFYFNLNPKAHGVDGDPECVATLRNRGHQVALANVLEGVPYADESFDYVLAHDVLEHFVESELVYLVGEVHRVLAAGGLFLVWVPNRRGYDFGVDVGVGHRLFVTRKEIESLARDRFALMKHYSEPLPRWVGERFVHNKEVFWLRKL